MEVVYGGGGVVAFAPGAEILGVQNLIFEYKFGILLDTEDLFQDDTNVNDIEANCLKLCKKYSVVPGTPG